MIGVCIKYFHANYGGMLQAYATCALLDSENYEYELIRYGKKRTTLEKVKSLPRLFNHILLNDKYEALVKKLGEMTHPEVACSTDNGDYPYVLKFMRRRGVKTKKNVDLATSNCSNCGSTINPGDKFCMYCGKQL